MTQRKTIDANDTHAALLRPNPAFISEAEFVKSDGSYREITVTIAGIAQEEIPVAGTGRSELLPVLSFEGKSKRMVIGNKANKTMLVELFGNFTRDWKGKEIVLWFNPAVKFGRKTVGGIRIKGKK